MALRYNLSLGNERFVQIVEWQGESRVDIRQWNHAKPTTKGVSVSLVQFKNLTTRMDWSMSLAFTQDDGKESYGTIKDASFHFAANIFLNAAKGSPCVNIRQFWKPPNQEDSVPTKKGLCLRPLEYKLFRERVPDMEESLQGLENVISCYMRDDHNNPLGM
jgi:hypothetical protein